jgi:hypothetical protein
MSAQAAGRAVAAGAKAAGKGADGHVLNKGAKRDPELYVSLRRLFSGKGGYLLQSIEKLLLIRFQVLFAVMSGAFGLAGFYFGTFFHQL